jgi:DNA-binding transcriptional LysR family regulator
VTFAQLRSYSEVARLGSVTQAARALGVTEPAVSSAVCSLRRELGDDLFVRAPGGIRFTPGGERLAQAAVEILLLAETTRRDLAEMH